MNKMDKILDILALVLGLLLIVGLVVGFVTCGWLPLRDLPSWVWFVAVLFFVLLLKGGRRDG